MSIVRMLCNKYWTYYFEIKRKFINMRPNICIGKYTVVERGAVLSTRYGGSITIGHHCHISRSAQILSCGGDIEVGNNSTFNPYSMTYGQGGTRIGNGVRIATQAAILPSNHNYSDRSKYIFEQGLSTKGIVIEDDVWIGAGVKVLDGVILRKGCIIGSNAVVSKPTEEYGIYVGIPARKIKNR